MIGQLQKCFHEQDKTNQISAAQFQADNNSLESGLFTVIWRALDRNNEQLTRTPCDIIHNKTLINIQTGEAHTSSLRPWNYRPGHSWQNWELPFPHISKRKTCPAHIHTPLFSSLAGMSVMNAGYICV